MAAANSEAVRKAIAEAFDTGFTALPIAFDNVQFSPPVDGTGWVALKIRWSKGQIETMSETLHRGDVVVELNLPSGSGDGDAYARRDEVAGVFSRKTLPTAASDVHFDGTSGPRKLSDAARSRWEVVTPFMLLETI